MNRLDKVLERRAEGKIERKAQKAARTVDGAIRHGEDISRVEVSIGRRPWGYKAEIYADKVGTLAVEKLANIGIDVEYAASETREASSKLCINAGVIAHDSQGFPTDVPHDSLTTKVMGRLTLVLTH